MKKLLVLAGLLSAIGISSAGRRFSQDVTVNLASKEAYGPLGSAHNSIDSVQYIGCVTARGATWAYGQCFAMTAASVQAGCYTNDAAMIDHIGKLKSDSHLYFQWDANGNCTAVDITTGSLYEPKR